MIIDSTFGISTRGYKALNVVVVDQHFRSVLVVTSFTVSEKVVAYKKTLGFINSVIQFNRLPLCLISDSAPQIHASVSDVYPYCRHIYCAFHLLKDLKLGKKRVHQSVVTLRGTLRKMQGNWSYLCSYLVPRPALTMHFLNWINYWKTLNLAALKIR